jgi:transcriptional regulator with XRE-family HTH domain
MYEGGTSRLNRWFKGESLPKPETLRKICQALQISYLEAIDRYGYYHELLRIFHDLVCLGEWWLEEDDARGGTLNPDGSKASRLASLRDLGVLYWHGAPIAWNQMVPHPNKSEPGNTFEDPEFRSRYITGWYNEIPQDGHEQRYPMIPWQGPDGLVYVPDISKIPTKPLPAIGAASPTVLPKPIALVIVLATIVFPRRGDIYKNEVRGYVQELYSHVDALIDQAEAQRSTFKSPGRPKLLHPLLESAIAALNERVQTFAMRRTVAAEYIISWADNICRPFTHYSRLAAFEYWGEVGSHLSNVTAFAQLPQLRRAELLDAGMFGAIEIHLSHS